MDGLLCPECGCPDVVVYSSFGSAVIPCRGGPCGRPQPTLSTIISTKSSLLHANVKAVASWGALIYSGAKQLCTF